MTLQTEVLKSALEFRLYLGSLIYFILEL